MTLSFQILKNIENFILEIIAFIAPTFYHPSFITPSSALYSKAPLQQRDLTQHHQNLLKLIDIKLLVSFEKKYY